MKEKTIDYKKMFASISAKNMFIVFIWALFLPYKCKVVEYWWDKGMHGAAAFNKAKETSRADYKKLKNKQENE